MLSTIFKEKLNWGKMRQSQEVPAERYVNTKRSPNAYWKMMKLHYIRKSGSLAHLLNNIPITLANLLYCLSSCGSSHTHTHTHAHIPKVNYLASTDFV